MTDARCILCDGPMVVVTTFPAPQEDPDLVCAKCHTLSPEVREVLRNKALRRVRDGHDD